MASFEEEITTIVQRPEIANKRSKLTNGIKTEWLHSGTMGQRG